MKRTVAFCTLGCRVNQYESRAVEETFLAASFDVVPFDEKSDVYVINTCTVTAESDAKSRKMIRRARKTGGEDAVVVVMGCMAQAFPEQVPKITGKLVVLGTGQKMKCLDEVLKILDGKDASETPKMRVTGADTTRAFIKIEDGCENHCAYCIIPRARGKVVSRDADDVIDEVKKLVKNGYKETVLTGIETASYGRDKADADLPSLVEMVNAVHGVERIRLGSLEPTVLKHDAVIRLANCRHMMPHYHLALQSGCDKILHAMRRKYNTKMFCDVLADLRACVPDVLFTTDLVVGFPGETVEDFEETCRFVEKCRFAYVHIFPYSDRTSTAASEMPDKVPEEEKKRRAAVMKHVMLDTRKKALSPYVGRNMTMLVEMVKNGKATGYTENFIELCCAVDDTVKRNDIIPVRITGFGRDGLCMLGEMGNGDF